MKKIFVALLFLVLVSVSLAGFYFLNLRPVSPNGSSQNFVINQGDSVKTIALHLQDSQLIRNRYVFLLSVYFSKLNNRLQAGLFKLSPSLSTPEIVAKLSTGGNQDYWLKIIEGQRLSELSLSFDKSLEGYVFPDSYLVPQDYQPEQIYQEIIKKNFDEKISQAKIGATSSLSDHDVLILASLLEREGRTLSSKEQIAGIILNRLSLGMALQIDATVQYARDSKISVKTYWQPVSKSDLSLNSPYNTYLNPGLPPGPICNPGYDSLYAAYHPATNDYLYYITGNDGKMYYSTTLEEHNAAVAKYLK